jgi:hypothetical protein
MTQLLLEGRPFSEPALVAHCDGAPIPPTFVDPLSGVNAVQHGVETGRNRGSAASFKYRRLG